MYGKSRKKPFVAKFDKLHKSLNLASVAAEDYQVADSSCLLEANNLRLH